jgi:uncharacterized protein (DUF1501 family)
MTPKCTRSRRSILRIPWQALAVSALTSTGAQNLIGAKGEFVRALVGIYLFGGNDSNGLLVPLSQYDSYAAARGPLALPRNSLLPATSLTDQAEYGFHPALAEIHSLFLARAAAVVSGVGHLRAPISRGTGLRVPVPQILSRHLDPDLDYLQPGYAVPSWAANLAGLGAQSSKGLIADFPSLTSQDSRSSALAVLTPGNSNPDGLRAPLTAIAKQPSGFDTVFPSSGIGQQLRQVAALIKHGPAAGLTHPIFVCGMSGFSTRTRQMERQTALFAELSAAMAAFYNATVEMGIARNVTAYTDTEYNRTLLPNKMLGTDPAWAGHHLVVGGSVMGGQVHGQFPQLSLGGPDDASGTGTWMPAISKHQFAATLAAWYGVNYGNLRTHLPEIANFAQPTLDFLGG